MGYRHSDHGTRHLGTARFVADSVACDYRRLNPGGRMYKTILVTLDGTATDRAIIDHIKQLAHLAQSRVVLLHVADGWAARTYGPDAVSPEISEDTAYLNKVRTEFQAAGISTDAEDRKSTRLN